MPPTPLPIKPNDLRRLALDILGADFLTRADVEAIKTGSAESGPVLTTLESAVALLADIENNTDGLEGFTDGLEGFVDGLETALSNIQGTLTLVQGYVDQLEGFSDGVETLLTAIRDNADQLEPKIDETNARLGEVSATPTANTIQDRLKSIRSVLDTLNAKDFATQDTLTNIYARTDIALSVLRDGIKGSHTLTDIYNQISNVASGGFYSDFGSASNLGSALNSEVVFDNVGGFSSISFRVVPPTGGTVVFEGTADGDNWDAATMRSTVFGEYVSQATVADILIGSISALRKFRVRVSVAGSANGSCKGRAQRDASTTEGAEFDQRPDKIGATLITKGNTFTTAQTGTVLWTPSSGKRIYVTSYKINARSTTDGTITIFDDTDTNDNWILPPTQYDVSVNNSIRDGEQFSIPYKAKAVGNSIKVTSVGNIDFAVVVRGYEALG